MDIWQMKTKMMTMSRCNQMSSQLFQMVMMRKPKVNCTDKDIISAAAVAVVFVPNSIFWSWNITEEIFRIIYIFIPLIHFMNISSVSILICFLTINIECHLCSNLSIACDYISYLIYFISAAKSLAGLKCFDMWRSAVLCSHDKYQIWYTITKRHRSIDREIDILYYFKKEKNGIDSANSISSDNFESRWWKTWLGCFKKYEGSRNIRSWNCEGM